MSNDWRRLLELSARAEEKFIATHEERYQVMARRYLDEAKKI